MTWLGVIICSWSYDDNAEINPYGFVVWLTCVTTAATYSMLAPGLTTRLGLTNDSQYFWLYFFVIFALLSVEIFVGKGDKEGLVINRIVATCTGVAMAMLFSWIPPRTRGGDPIHTQIYWDALSGAFVSVLTLFAGVKDELTPTNAKDAKAKFMTPVQEKRKYASFLLKDASRFHILPILNPNKALNPLIGDMQVTETYIGHLIDIYYEGLNEDEKLYLQNPVRDILKEISGDMKEGGDEESGAAVITDDLPVDRKLIVLQLCYFIHDRLKSERTKLDSTEK